MDKIENAPGQQFRLGETERLRKSWIDTLETSVQAGDA
jgi:hypothetical protein